MNAMNVKTNVDMFGPLGSADKNKQWQRELLMERLRTHSAQNKTFAELSKAMRMSMLEKRYSLDPTERGNLQKCLDSMQHCIKVTTRQGLIERLESLSRQLGLKFMEDTSGLFISSDMFYLEIVLDSTGTLSDVKVHHECKIEQQSCSELVTCLLKGDFADFTTQLEGLSSIYQLNAEPKVKSKAFVALQAMEMDLYSLYSAQNFHKDTQVILLESSVGLVQKRRGGHPMKLTYFVSPYDLLNLEAKSLMPLSLDVMSTQNIGMHVTVNLEPSNPNKLQILPTVTLNSDGQSGASIPVFSALNPANSTILPATFVLRLNKPIPICESLLDAISAITQQSFNDPPIVKSSVMELVVQTASNGELKNSNKGLFVSLPDQNHCYFFTENKLLKGSVITSIPYTEPSHVPNILTCLRQQALFHTLLASCVRPESKMGDLENTTMLEVSAINIHQISVALEHPFEESMATVEFDLKDASNIDCRIYSLPNNYDAVAIKLTKIIQKTLSIPITIRALLKFWDQEQMKGFHRGGNGIDNGNFSLPLGPNDPGGRMNDFRDIKPKNERALNGNYVGGNRQFFHASAVMMGGPTDALMDGGMHMFDNPHEGTIMMNQFAMKSMHDSNFFDTKESIGGEDFYKSPKSKTEMAMNQMSSDTSDSSSLGASTPTSDLGVARNINMGRDSNLDSSSNSPYVDGEASRTSANENLADVGQKSSAKIERSLPEEWRMKNSSIDTKVSILPVKSGLELNSMISGMGLERRPGIEIIPITATTTQSLPTSITITPITSSSKGERKSSSSRKYDEKSRSEKKRKRRKEDSSSMGPPDKIVSKQDGMSRSLSVSIKSTDGSAVLSSELLKKISSSGSKLSSSSSGRPSPKNSPSHISPKHLSGGTHSPKTGHYNTSSPKHSSGSSGKPSMSALKSVTSSSPKSEKSSSKSSSSLREKDRDREKERSGSSKSSSLGLSISGGGNSPKLKASTVKLKQIDLSAALLSSTDHFTFDEATESETPSMSGILGSAVAGKLGISSSSGTGLLNKVRKGSLSAVIDKLKSAQHTGDDMLSNAGISPSDTGSNRDKCLSAGSGSKIQYNSSVNHSVKSITSSLGTTGITSLQASQNSEYMIKPSLDGMKITINKTRSKDSPNHSLSSGSNSSSSKSGSTSAASANSFSKIFSSSGSGSPKRHTGLKPGVNSGPASKKSQGTSKSNNSNSQSHSGVQGRGNFQKSSSSGNLSASSSSKNSFPYSSGKSLSSGALSNSTEPLKKDKAKNRTDASDVMKMLGFASPMDGFMKSLNTKFQIPKLSARTNDDPKKSDPSKLNTSSSVSINTTAVASVAPTITSPTTSLVPSSKPSGTVVTPVITTANEGSKPVLDILPKDVQSKFPFSVSKLPMETVAQSSSVPTSNAITKPSNYYGSNPTPPKYPHDAPNRNSKSPMSYIPVMNSITYKETSPKTILPAAPISTSTPPIHLISPPYTPTAVSQSPTFRSCSSSSSIEASATPTTVVASRQTDEIVMRPPSAPCANTAIDISSAAAAEIVSNKIECSSGGKSCFTSQQQRTPSTENTTLPLEVPNSMNPSVVRKMNPNALLPQHKISFPASPSVSVHIVKSPAPSPLMVLPSPHSNSPCITDDELMDEALVGISGK